MKQWLHYLIPSTSSTVENSTDTTIQSNGKTVEDGPDDVQSRGQDEFEVSHLKKSIQDEATKCVSQPETAAWTFFKQQREYRSSEVDTWNRGIAG